MWRVNMETGKPPAQWEVTHFADIGTLEEFVQQLSPYDPLHGAISIAGVVLAQ